MSANDQTLPAAKEKQYESLVKCYEEKEYKKGIKVANTILKDYPKNGKTLCMKALVNYLITKDKVVAEKEIKASLMLDPKNDMCWQTLGLFYRHCKNYAEARKAFSMASMRNPSNLQVTIDLATLHIQNRDIAGYRKCYQKLIGQLSSRGNFWLGMMVGYCLEGNYSKCLEAVSVYRNTLPTTPSYERQELVLLEVRCYVGMKDYAKAISTLTAGMKDILNEDAAKEQLAILYGKNNQLEESQKVWESLLQRNNENYRYYRGIECCLLKCFDKFESMEKMELLSTSGTCSDAEVAVLLAYYQPLLEQARPSQAVQTICMYLMKDVQFEALASKQIKRAIRKGIPSFFRSIRPLLTLQQSKFETVQSIAESFLASIQQTGCIDDEEEDPFVFLWLVLLLAQIEDAQHNTQKALHYTDLAYAHTPTCYDYYIIRARILKHAGQLKESAAVLAKGYALDLADRFTNTKLTKYYLKSGAIAEADQTVSYWTKKNIPNRIDLNNLQGNWFEVLCSTSYLTKHDYVHANKLCLNVINHFDTYVENQFDFHPYVLRKQTLSSYFKFLQYVDQIYNHKYYKTAACGALACAVELAAKPLTDPAAYLQQFGSIPDTQGKKEDEDDVDADLDGIKLAQYEKPLERVEPVAKRLVEVAPKELRCLEAVLAWAIAAKNTALLSKVLMNAKGVSEIAWAAMLKRVEQAGLMNDEWKTGFDEDAIVVGVDDSLIDSIRYLAEVRGLDVAVGKIGNVKRFTLQQLKDCYTAFVELKATQDDLVILRNKAREFFEGVDEYLNCLGF